MESFHPPTGTGFCCNPNSNNNSNSGFSGGILEIYVHHARNIHNICIYDNQDVYAKFSLTYNPDDTISTRIINGGGKNPDFNQSLAMKVAQNDAVLKCEIWMQSRAKNLMEDQLLGFALVPISSIKGKQQLTQEFSLSSTDLFHSPAGTVKLTLSFNTSLPLTSIPNSSITSEVVLLDRKISEVARELDPVEYSNIEFPDISVVRENQRMLSHYFDLAGQGSASRPALIGSGSFLHLGAATNDPIDHDYEMGANSSEENQVGSVSPDGSIQNSSGFLSSTMTSLSDDRNSSDCNSLEKVSHNTTSIAGEAANQSPETPTSKKGSEVRDRKKPHFPGKEEEGSEVGKMKFGQVFSSPVASINNIEAEESVMQQQIVDMYMRSMQQFTESLAKMKLPMDLTNKPEAQHRHGNEIQNDSNLEVEAKKKHGSRVFYGSRAFF